jgi:hypothetical protein
MIARLWRHRWQAFGVQKIAENLITLLQGDATRSKLSHPSPLETASAPLVGPVGASSLAIVAEKVKNGVMRYASTLRTRKPS